MANDKPTTTIKVGDRVEAPKHGRGKVLAIVGDRVEAPKHGRGKVLAIVGDNAWVQTEVRDYPLTFDVHKLKLVPKPKVGLLGELNRSSWDGSQWVTIESNREAIELTDEVRERIKDLL